MGKQLVIAGDASLDFLMVDKSMVDRAEETTEVLQTDKATFSTQGGKSVLANFFLYDYWRKMKMLAEKAEKPNDEKMGFRDFTEDAKPEGSNPEVSGEYKDDYPAYTAISEWSVKDYHPKEGAKEQRLYFDRNIARSDTHELPFRITRSGAKFDEVTVISPLHQSEADLKAIDAADLIAIHNVTDKAGLDHVNDHLLKHIKRSKSEAVIVLRTMLNEEGRLTKLAQGIADAKGKDGRILLADRTVLLLHAEDLRKGGFQIGTGISWQQLARETIRGVEGSDLKNFRYVIVCFEQEGALIITSKYDEGHSEASKYEARLLCYPGQIENESRTDKEQRKCFSKTLTIQIGLINALLRGTPEQAEGITIENGVREGILAVHKLTEVGYTIHGRFSHYPVEDIHRFLQTGASADSSKTGLYAFTYDAAAKQFTECSDDRELPQRIIEYGVEAELRKIPHLRFNNFFSVDDSEIEGYRGTCNLLLNYIGDQTQTKPLSICVFGDPGSGKSFGVKQMVKYINKQAPDGIDLFPVEFNLSQSSDTASAFLEELSKQFVQVQSVAIRGHIPFVFWDEFDANEYDYLKYFLAPMQDGKFLLGGQECALGKTVFVFAGGTAKTMDVFKQDTEKRTDYLQKKIPDFISRISGYIDIKDINPPKASAIPSATMDNMVRIRRAILLRSMLEEKYCLEGRHINIRTDALEAYLDNCLYKFSIRSMRAIVFAGNSGCQPQLKSYTMACRPDEKVIKLHTEPWP